MSETQIGEIGNYYGSLSVRVVNGRAEWGIEDHAGTHWEEIPKYLYDALMRFHNEPAKPIGETND